MEKEIKKENEKILLKAFEDVYNLLISSNNVQKNKIQYQSELIEYALNIYANFGNVSPLKKLVVNTGLFTTFKGYFESIGLFMYYKASEQFLKVIKDTEGDFIKGVYPTFENWKKEQPKKQVNVDFKKRLTTLFKKKTKKEIESIINEFLKNIK